MHFVFRSQKFVVFITAMAALCFSMMYASEQQLPDKTIRLNYQTRFDQFKHDLNRLILVLKKNQNDLKQKDKSAKQAYIQVRASYKRLESMLEFIDPYFVKDHINGTPFQKPERSSFGLNSVEPKGLQMLETALYEQNDLQAALNYAQQMHDALQNYVLPLQIQSTQFFEAARLEIIRCFTLHLTGFDTPASGNGIQDAYHALSALQEDFQMYSALAQNQPSYLTTIAKLQQARRYLQFNTNFDAFDRLYFLTTCINPLYKSTLDLQQALSIELPLETGKKQESINYITSNLFSPNFLNPASFHKVPTNYLHSKTVALGKLLFYDPLLSHQQTISCASCHHPTKGFSDGLAKSNAFEPGKKLARNAPGLVNCIFSERFFHDLRAQSLEDQTEHVINSPDEFNTSMLEILRKLRKSSTYVQLFKEAFPASPTKNPIEGPFVQYAISAYVSSLVGLQSPFDQYVCGQSSNLSPEVKLGFNLFMGKAGCGTCHFAPIFNGTVPPLYKESESEVLGVPADPNAASWQIDTDLGRSKGILTENAPYYQYSFKTPTVRNIALTSPYMHNGAFKTLKEVVEFYNHGGGAGKGMHVPYQTLPAKKLQLNSKEINAIVSFMNALTDTSGLISVPDQLPSIDLDPNLQRNSSWRTFY